MGFMQPQTQFSTNWVRIEATDGSSHVAARTDVSVAELARYHAADAIEELGEGYCARLSAPGYLDCTDWSGPFATEKQALQELAELHGLCAHCMADDCREDDVTSQCYAAALETLQSNVRIATGEALRGRIRETSNEWIPGEIRDSVARLRELDPRDEVAGDGPTSFRIARAARLGIDKARREILQELRDFVRGMSQPNVSDALLLELRCNAQARFRFPEGR
jgi:hypothetical protein